MSTTLSYGFIKPQSGDPMATWQSALESDVQQVNDHTHDGTNSALISAKSISTGTVTTTSWTLVSTGVYRQLLTCPTGFLFDSSTLNCRQATTKEVLHPTIEKVSSTTFYVYTCDNSTNIEVIFK